MIRESYDFRGTHECARKRRLEKLKIMFKTCLKLRNRMDRREVQDTYS